MNKVILVVFAMILLPFIGEAQNTSPTIQPLPNQTVFVDHPALVILEAADTETPTNQLQIRLTSSNPTLIPASNVVVHYFIFDGRWYITVAPAFGLTGLATNTVTVSDGTNSASTDFVLTVTPPPPGAMRFSNTNAITIPSAGVASPYPSTINVTGMAGTVTDLTLSVSQFNHQYIHDLNMLLVGPSNQAVVVFSHVSGNTVHSAAATNVNFTLTDASPYVLPQVFELWSEQFRPTDWNTNDFFPPPAPPATNGHYSPVTFAAFHGLPANGTWSLYVYDEEAPDNGSIAGGWSLMITTTVPSPVLELPILTDTNAILSWSAVAGVNYRVQFKPDLAVPDWTDLAGDITASGTNATKEDPTFTSATNRFYRVQVLP